MKYIFITIAILLSSNILGASEIQDSLIEVGKTLFKTNCKACHNIDKKLVGPALSKVYERRDSSWLYQFIQGSQAMITAGDPIATELYMQFNEVIMPDQKTDKKEIDLILAYIKNHDNKINVASDNPIQRPASEAIEYSFPFRFSNFMFWIPYTLSVVFGIFVLYYMTVLYDLKRNED